MLGAALHRGPGASVSACDQDPTCGNLVPLNRRREQAGGQQEVPRGDERRSLKRSPCWPVNWGWQLYLDGGQGTGGHQGGFVQQAGEEAGLVGGSTTQVSEFYFEWFRAGEVGATVWRWDCGMRGWRCRDGGKTPLGGSPGTRGRWVWGEGGSQRASSRAPPWASAGD